jgi:cis-3-alkyl-4-acyloxetan-2-one decarboxylase
LSHLAQAPTTKLNPVLQRFLEDHPGRDLDRGGLRLHYIDEGSGDPLVMLHGNPTWSFYYRHLIDDLRDSHRMIVPDHIGCGLSDKPDDSRYDYTLASRVDDLERLLDRLGLDRDLTFVLHDWGGIIGTTFAARHPERIARLVVCNTAAFHKPADKSFPWALSLFRDTPLGSALVRGLNLFVRGTAWIGCKNRRLSWAVRDAYAAPYDSWAHRIAIHRFVQDIPLRPRDRSYELISWVESRLARLEPIPMLIVWGMKDFVFDAPILGEWVRRFPRAEVYRFEGAGHLVFEDEREAVSGLLRSFLMAHPLIREPVG